MAVFEFMLSKMLLINNELLKFLIKSDKFSVLIFTFFLEELLKT